MFGSATWAPQSSSGVRERGEARGRRLPNSGPRSAFSTSSRTPRVRGSMPAGGSTTSISFAGADAGSFSMCSGSSGSLLESVADDQTRRLDPCSLRGHSALGGNGSRNPSHAVTSSDDSRARPDRSRRLVGSRLPSCRLPPGCPREEGCRRWSRCQRHGRRRCLPQGHHPRHRLLWRSPNLQPANPRATRLSARGAQKRTRAVASQRPAGLSVLAPSSVFLSRTGVAVDGGSEQPSTASVGQGRSSCCPERLEHVQHRRTVRQPGTISRPRWRGPGRFRPALAFSCVRPHGRAAGPGRLDDHRGARVAADLKFEEARWRIRSR